MDAENAHRDTSAARLWDWYAREALAQSWPRDTLNIQIKSQLHVR